MLFLVVSVLLARAFNAESAERAAITSLVQAEARGDLHGAVGLFTDCGVACRVRLAQAVGALKHPGSVAILQVEPSTSFALTGSTGTARVAWTVGGSLPIVQCVGVRHVGTVISGLRVELLAVTLRLHSDAVCPKSVTF